MGSAHFCLKARDPIQYQFFSGGHVSESEDEEHSSAIQTPGQLLTVLLAAFGFPIVIILMLAQFATGDILTSRSDEGLSPEEIAKRLRPVGTLVLAEDLPQLEAEFQAASRQAQADAGTVQEAGGPGDAKSIYTASCAACHASGAAGAPKLDDKGAWAGRLGSGIDTLYKSALNGKNAMPPKGGNAALSDDDVKAVVDYMVEQVK
ncbi:Cytochrome c5 [Nitrosovibrio sp. Nv17]|jgi:cytochrome c5|nr:Cytochrome c5 [Nitrosovibrio sp. Nv17]